MTFRTRLLLIFTLAVVVSVGLVELLVLGNMREVSEHAETQRLEALVAPFRTDVYTVAECVKGGPGVTALGEWRLESLWLEGGRP
jgi:hypothetical protein